MTDYISRALVVGERTLTEAELLQEGNLFVVLAEPGAGKTELLKKLAELLHTERVKASIFRHRPPPSGTGPLVIDAMDEVARIDTLATDQIITQACDATTGTVIFAGRSGEWDNGRTAHVENCFGVKPIVVRLEPFDEDEQRKLFGAQFPGEDFDAFAQETKRFELLPLLGNPQFLQLLGSAYLESNRVFTSKAKIFADAVRRLAHEANTELPRQKAKPPTGEIVALGAEVFAKLLLSGATGISTIEQLSDRDFPFINGLCPKTSEPAFLIDTRLFKPSDDADKHEPIHRIVAEYCAADYLVKRIEDSSDRLTLDRVLSIVAPNGVTRDELRGMLGWMAALGREQLQLTVIKLDPYAILANGDPSRLTPKAKRLLLGELDRLSDIDPMFRRSDVWRRFNVGHFFTADILDAVRLLLGKQGVLRSLILELLIESEAASGLTNELASLMKDTTADGNERKLALEVLLSIPAYDPVTDFASLMAEGSADALEIASRIVTKRGVAAAGAPQVSALLEKLGGLYPAPNKRHRDGMSRYFIEVLVRSLAVDDLPAFLDALSSGLTCTCGAKHDYQCTCRYGKSKIIGRLLDRYFEYTPAPHDPARLWTWIRALHFQSGVSAERSAAVKHLGQDHDLRRAMQRMAVDGVAGAEAARDAVIKLYSSHAHSGLHMHEGDPEALSDYAFENGLVDLWTALFAGHNIWSESKAPNALRAAQRAQSRTSRDFLAAWSERERARRTYVREELKVGRVRNRRNRAEREAAVEANNRAFLRANLAQIEAGQHWGWLKRFSHLYLLEPDDLTTEVDDPETPLRALRNCFPFLEPHIPEVEVLARREWTAVAEALLASCLLRFREGDDLKAIDPRILAAVKTEMSSYPALKEGEEEAFEMAVDAALFTTPDAAESFVRRYLEVQLSSADEAPVSYYWLDNKDAFHPLRIKLPLDWLERFPQMPLDAMRSLFSMAAKYGDRKELLGLITRRLADPVVDCGEDSEADKRARNRRKFWQLNAYFYQAPGSGDAWEDLKTDPKTIFALEDRLGRFSSSDGEDRPSVTAEQVFQIMDAFVDVWPKVPLPSMFGSGDPEDESAYRFLTECIWKVNEDAPDHRVPVLDRIVADPRFADFRDTALTLKAEAGRKMALQDFRAPSPSEINGLLDKNEVASVEDLRALMVEELRELQKWLKGSETDPLDSFYSGGKRIDENTARNRIVDRLQGRMTALGLSVVIERHMAGGNRCDITASATVEGASRLLVTEVKGQWNKELYTAASVQLDQRYAIHPDAEQQGVYLALWYGNGEKVANLVDRTITTAEELRERIVASMPEELRNRVDVVVLDLSRSTPKMPRPPKKQAAKTAKPRGAPRKKVTPTSD